MARGRAAPCYQVVVGGAHWGRNMLHISSGKLLLRTSYLRPYVSVC